MSPDERIADPIVSAERERMLALLRRQVHDEGVISAMAAVPRERFVASQYRDHAYDDRALPTTAGQTISQPLIVALMTEAAEPRPDDRVLDVGTGSGYQAAVLCQLVREVISVERVAELQSGAELLLRELGYENVRLFPAGDILGRPQDAPYDVIVVAAGAPHVPRGLLAQLAPGGRLIIPVGDRTQQQLVRARRTPHGISLQRLGPCAFVPLIGTEAWPEAEDGRASRRLKV
jgi:protein-L-isoaspartate(D-aspartate) O-methyltransferase